jgi:hypothetical protein
MQPRAPRRGLLEQQGEEDLDPRHFYAASVFDQARERGDDISALIERAQFPFALAFCPTPEISSHYAAIDHFRTLLSIYRRAFTACLL